MRLSLDLLREEPRRCAPAAVAGGGLPPLHAIAELGIPSAKCYGDRFIPHRSAMDMDMAHYLLTEPRKDKENAAGMVASPSKEAYRRLLRGSCSTTGHGSSPSGTSCQNPRTCLSPMSLPPTMRTAVLLPALARLLMSRTLRGVLEARVGSLAWNNSILSTGGMDGKIVNNDVRIRNHVVQTYKGHSQEVCGLKWSGSGQQLASEGNDDLVHIWDVLMASSLPSAGHNQWLHRLEDHVAAVKALAWWQRSVHQILAHTHCSCMVKLQSPDGCTVASAAADETLRFWNVFGAPETPKPAAKASHTGTFNSFNHIR
ncbi:Cell division cycle 20.1 cofactor of APC complex [Zea mays]|uniref:Cell division cycle 20.1 cofactor of APC complex n=1 Tax=Zea mays TaxID=4577 RepID=A0A1D6HH17_MAIZE|nr:Cell division cycle 20.1 cofactor of APC complex [Zea mays]